jgi:hypothetical protein
VGSLFDDGEISDAWNLAHWRVGQTSAKVNWIDGQGAEHLSIVFNEREGRELLNLIARDGGARVISCYVQ